MAMAIETRRASAVDSPEGRWTTQATRMVFGRGPGRPGGTRAFQVPRRAWTQLALRRARAEASSGHERKPRRRALSPRPSAGPRARPGERPARTPHRAACSAAGCWSGSASGGEAGGTVASNTEPPPPPPLPYKVHPSVLIGRAGAAGDQLAGPRRSLRRARAARRSRRRPARGAGARARSSGRARTRKAAGASRGCWTPHRSRWPVRRAIPSACAERVRVSLS